MKEFMQEMSQDIGKHSLQLILQVAWGYIFFTGEWGGEAARSSRGQSGAHQPPGSPPGAWLRAAGVGGEVAA